MSLARLKVDGVRCLGGVDIELESERNYVFGPNGAGKTSLLESIHLLGRGRSFRTRQTARLVQRGREGLTVHGSVRGVERTVPVGVGFADHKLTARVDGHDEGTAGLARALPVYVIDPQLHQLVEAGPSERRRYLDWGVFHVEHSYLSLWRQYRRLLGQRNAALKRGAAGEQLAAWTEPLVELGERITAMRERYVAGLTPDVAAMGARLLGRDVQVSYFRGWREGVDLAEALAEARERERERGTTPVGPHRADLVIRIDGERARDEVSRGQQKLIVGALVLAQVDRLGGTEAHRSVLLVDDPAAELDGGSLGRLMEEVYARPVQLVVTALSAEALGGAADFPRFHVEQGRVRAVV